MALDTYTGLTVAIAKWLNRNDLTAQIPDFITIAEKQIQRRVRRKKIRASVQFSTEAYSLPADAAALVSVRLSSSTPSRDLSLDIVTPEALAEVRARHNAVAGRPTHASVLNDQLVLAPAPDRAYDAEIIYFEKVPSLGSEQPSNSVLVEAPDAYLYGALMEAAPYLLDDDRVPVWEAKFEKAVRELDLARDREEFGSGFRPIRLPVVFGERPRF